MKVRDVMTKQTAFCGPETNLAQAVELMWKNACGFLPVAGEGGNVIGVITDRDISIALGTRDRRASEVCVRSAMSSRLFACTPDDDVHTALKTLKSEGIRRLPVIDREGMLMGVLSERTFPMRTSKIRTERSSCAHLWTRTGGVQLRE
jgi:CBS domain-containing protein